MFSKLAFPLTGGIQAGKSRLATTEPSLQELVNADISIAGEVRAREAEVVVTSPIVSRSRLRPDLRVTGIEALTDTYDVIGCAEHAGEALFHVTGQMYAGKAGSIMATGPHWSVTEETTPGGVQAIRDEAVCAGDSIVGYGASLPASYYSLLDGSYPAHPTMSAGSLTASCSAGGGMFVVEGSNVKLSSGFPSATVVTLATDFSGGSRGLWVIKSGGGYLLAYTRAADVRVLRLNTSGGTLGTATFSTGILGTGGSTRALSLGMNAATGVVALLGCAHPSTSVVLIQMDATTLVSALTETHTVLEAARDCGVGCQQPLGPLDSWRAVLQTGPGSIRLYSFEETDPGTWAATGVMPYTQLGGGVGSAWKILFPPTAFRSRAVMGLLHFQNDETAFGGYLPKQLATWLIVDAQDLAPVASGDEGTCAVTRQGSSAGGTVLRFGVLEGAVYEREAVAQGRAVVKTLEASPVVSARVNGTTYFSGQLPYLYDGVNTLPVGFPLRPEIGVSAAAGGAWGAGSYTFQACWSVTDKAGNTHRSAPSDKFSLTFAVTSELTVTATMPTWLQFLAGDVAALEIYCTVPNPSQNAGLYLVASANFSSAGSAEVFLEEPPVIPSTGMASRPPLYTNGGVMENNRPVATRGLVAAGGRVWCSDGRRLLASKLPSAGEGLAWSYLADDSLTLLPPPSAGEVRGLGAVDDVVIALCADSAVLVGGRGPADTGGPSDFTDPREVYSVPGPALPSGVCNAPTSVVWSSSAGGIHAINAGGQGTSLGESLGGTYVRVSFLPAVPQVDGTTRSPRLLAAGPAGFVAVMSLATGAWTLYQFDGLVRDLTVAAEPVTGKATVFLSVEDVATLEYLSSSSRFSSYRFRTNPFLLGPQGRLHALIPEGRVFSDGTTLAFVVYQDQAGSTGSSKTVTVDTQGANYPRTGLPTWVIPRPHMTAFAFGVTVVGDVALSHVTAEVQNRADEPRKTR